MTVSGPPWRRDLLTRQIIGAAIEVHRCLGPGLLESAYQKCLAWELHRRGISAASDVPVNLVYKGATVDASFRIDLVIEAQAVVEVKSVIKLLPVHESQLLTYMKLSSISTGLLINFNMTVLKDGIRRLVL
jgi:GxxExxY protein